MRKYGSIRCAFLIAGSLISGASALGQEPETKTPGSNTDFMKDAIIVDITKCLAEANGFPQYVQNYMKSLCTNEVYIEPGAPIAKNPDDFKTDTLLDFLRPPSYIGV